MKKTVIVLFIIWVLLMLSIPFFGQETTISFDIDTNFKKQQVIDSLLNVYDRCDILVITKVSKKKLYVKTLCNQYHEPLRKKETDKYETGNYLTLLPEYNFSRY
jgi:hypothetical protein